VKVAEKQERNQVSEVTFLESWGIIFEGPVRKTARSKLGEILGVPGAQFPILTRLRRIIRGG